MLKRSQIRLSFFFTSLLAVSKTQISSQTKAEHHTENWYAPTFSFSCLSCLSYLSEKNFCSSNFCFSLGIPFSTFSCAYQILIESLSEWFAVVQKWVNCGGSETPGNSIALSTNNPKPNPHLRTSSNLHIPHEAQIWIAAAVVLIERIGKDGYINIVFSGHVDIATVKLSVLSLCKHNKQVFRTICMNMHSL